MSEELLVVQNILNIIPQFQNNELLLIYTNKSIFENDNNSNNNIDVNIYKTNQYWVLTEENKELARKLHRFPNTPRPALARKFLDLCSDSNLAGMLDVGYLRG
jgi:hypothetical protein